MPERQTIGVVTVTYNGANLVDDFMQSLSEQTHRHFRLFIVDNASSDDTLTRLDRWRDSRTTIIRNTENKGVAEGNNQGIRAALSAGCDSVLLINNDTVFERRLFEKLLASLTDLDCDMVAPKILYCAEPTRIWAAGGDFQKGLGFRIKHHGFNQQDHGLFDTIRRITYVPTCCVLARSQVFERVGYMDPKYFVYFDDVDFMYRAMLAGIRLMYVPHARLLHKVSHSTGGLHSEFTVKFSARNRAYFLRKHLKPMACDFYSFLYLAYYAIRLLSGRDSVRFFRLKVTSFLRGLRMVAGGAGGKEFGYVE